jgi:hypothetical protein
MLTYSTVSPVSMFVTSTALERAVAPAAAAAACPLAKISRILSLAA